MKPLDDSGLQGALNDGQTLFSFLGSFWKHVCGNPEFVERFCEALGLLSVQAEQKKNEAMSASGRTLLPPFARERWLRVVLRREDKNKCEASKPKLSDSAPVIGPQSGGKFLVGTVPVVGAGYTVDGKSFYGLSRKIVSAVSMHERVFDPEISLSSGTDFEISDGAVSFSAGKDPTGNPSFREDPDTGGTVVWLKDAMVDMNYVSDYAGYVVKMAPESSQYGLDVVNAFWDMVNSGATKSALSYFVCKVLDIHCAEEDETILFTRRDSQGFHVLTDKRDYLFKHHPASNVRKGTVLHRGDPIDGSIRIRSGASGSDGSVFLGRGFFSGNVKGGLGFSGAQQPVVFHGRDANGNPVLRFPVSGDPSDVEAFFSDCRERCEQQHVDMASLLGVSVPSNASPGDVLEDTVSPGKFVSDNLVGGRMAVLEITASHLSPKGRAAIGMLDRIFEVFPVGSKLAIRVSAGEFLEQYDCIPASEPVIVGSARAVDVFGPVATEKLEIFMVPAREVDGK